MTIGTDFLRTALWLPTSSTSTSSWNAMVPEQIERVRQRSDEERTQTSGMHESKPTNDVVSSIDLPIGRWRQVEVDGCECRDQVDFYMFDVPKA